MTEVRITYVGSPTALLEIGPWRILTDPTFDPPGSRYMEQLVTTDPGARRLGGSARGLAPWGTTTLVAPGRCATR